MKKVLVIVYYWPPSGGSGVQRWVMFVKHLRKFGWEPVIFTPDNPSVGEEDLTLIKEIPENIEVIKLPIFDILKFFGNPLASNKTVSEKPPLFSRIKKSFGWFIRSNFFIPDPRIFWIKPSVKFLTNYLSNHKIDAIVTSGPPNSMHLIGKKLHSVTKIPWVSDFRDPWLEVLKFHNFNMSNLVWKRHEKLFNNVLKNSNAVITAHPSVGINFRKLTSTPVHVITNGYDKANSKETSPAEKDPEKFRLVFVGILYDTLNSSIFWKELSKICEENIHFRNKLELYFVGKVMESAMHDLEKNNLMSFATFTGYVDYKAALSYAKSANGLLIFTPNGDEFKYVIPGKLFEYLSIEKPIICIAPEASDIAEIILETNSGKIAEPEDSEKINQVLNEIFADYTSGSANNVSIGYEKYERYALTEKLSEVLNSVVD